MPVANRVPGAPTTPEGSMGVKGPSAPLRSRKPWAAVRPPAVVETTICPRLLIPKGKVTPAPGASNVV